MRTEKKRAGWLLPEAAAEFRKKIPTAGHDGDGRSAKAEIESRQASEAEREGKHGLDGGAAKVHEYRAEARCASMREKPEQSGTMLRCGSGNGEWADRRGDFED